MSQAAFSTPDPSRPSNGRWWIAALIYDRAIASSWICFLAAAVYESYVMSGGWGKHPTRFDVRDVFQGALVCGYCAWAFYWALRPGLIWLRRLRQFWPAGSLAAFILGLFVFLGLAFVLLICYPLLGGGIYGFLRQWYRAAFAVYAPPPSPVAMTASPQPGIPAAAAEPPPSSCSNDAPPSDVDRRLQTLARLRDGGAITEQEYQEQRLVVLRSI